MPRLQILQHKSYHPYLEKNKQRVREDEAKAAAEEEARERERIDAENKNRLDALRRKAGSPGIDDPSDAPGVSGASGVASGTAQTSTADEDAGDLPSSSAFKQLEGGNLMERHRKAKARAEKEERRRKERLDFDFPSETARKEKRRAEKDGLLGTAAGPSRMANTASGFDQPSSGGVGSDGESMWTSGGHLNLFADLERAEENATGGPSTGMSLGAIAKAKVSEGPKPDAYTMFLSRPDRETKPWYTDREMKRAEEKETGDEAEKRRARDRRKEVRSKERHDPLTTINSLLTKDPSTIPRSGGSTKHMSERERALAMIAQKKGGAGPPGGGAWDDTPSSAAGWAERNQRDKDRAGNRFYGSDSGYGRR